jgi:hypothetical protein
VFDEDWEYLEQVYGPGSDRPLGIGPAIRQVIHAYVTRLQAQTQKALDTVTNEEQDQ